MRSSCLWLLGAVVLAPVGAGGQAAAPPQRPAPLRRAISQGKVIIGDAVFAWPNVPPEKLRDNGLDGREIIPDCSFLSAWFQPLRGGRPEQVQFKVEAINIPLRWHIGHGAL